MRRLQAREARRNTAHDDPIESSDSSPTSAKEHRLRTLLVEDDDVDAKLIRLQAQSIRGFKLIIERVATSAEAEDRLLSGDYDLCIFDFWLGSESTLPLIEKLGGREGKMPIIILTGLTAPCIRELGFNAGAVSYLGKDHLASATLEDAIATALETRAVEKKLRQDDATAKRLPGDERAKVEAQMRHMLVEVNTVYACASKVRASFGSTPTRETNAHLSALMEKVECIRIQLTDNLFGLRGSGPDVLLGRYDIVDLIEEALKLAQGVLDARNQTVRLNRPDVGTAVECDSASIYFLLHEVIQKMSGMLPLGSAIVITTNLDAGSLFVTFLGHCDGPATISAFTLNWLFSGILKDHGGDMDVQQDEGRAPTVSLRLPLRSETRDALSAA